MGRGDTIDASGLQVWTHFSNIDAPGFRALIPGQHVLCDYEIPGQDGYPARAVRITVGEATPPE